MRVGRYEVLRWENRAIDSLWPKLLHLLLHLKNFSTFRHFERFLTTVLKQILSSSLRTFELFWWWKKVPQSIIPLRLCFLEKCLVEKYLFWQRRWLLQSQHFDTLDRWVLQENVGRSKRSMLPLYLCRLFLCVQGRKNCFKKVVTSTLALKPPQNNFEFYYALWVKI